MEPKTPPHEAGARLTSESGEFSAPTGEQLPVNIEQHEVEHTTPERVGESHRATTAVPTPISLPTPVPVDDVSDDQSNSTTSDNPEVAADEDLIEKEWVDKAKKIIEDTKEDPHMREKEVNKLQADYLRKRYGKELGEAT